MCLILSEKKLYSLVDFRMSNQPSSKPQTLRKSGSKDGSESGSSQSVECESPSGVK